MRTPGEAPQPGSTGQRGRRPPRFDEVIAILVIVLVSTLTVIISAPFVIPPMQPQAVQGQLVFGAAAYALAIVAALLARGMASAPMRRLRLVIIAVLASLMLWPTFVGSMAVTFALIQLTGNRWDGFVDIMYVLFLWWVWCVSLAHVSQRTAEHV
jgi:hypothetical protein